MKVIVDLKIAIFMWLMWDLGAGIVSWISGYTDWEMLTLWLLAGGLPVLFIVLTGDFVDEKGERDANIHS